MGGIVLKGDYDSEKMAIIIIKFIYHHRLKGKFRS